MSPQRASDDSFAIKNFDAAWTSSENISFPIAWQVSSLMHCVIQNRYRHHAEVHALVLCAWPQLSLCRTYTYLTRLVDSPYIPFTGGHTRESKTPLHSSAWQFSWRDQCLYKIGTPHDPWHVLELHDCGNLTGIHKNVLDFDRIFPFRCLWQSYWNAHSHLGVT